MVTIKAAHLRDGDKGQFISLELEGDLELVQSTSTGKFYATVRKCFISSTFDEETAQRMVGKQIKGSIVRTEVEQF